MSIRPIDFNGMIQNANEVSQVKAHEDARPELQQHSLLVETNRQTAEDATRVKSKSDVEKDDLNPEDGDGTGYNGNQRDKKKRKNKKSVSDGIVKKMDGHDSFDIKI